jgi:MYXO-CTERM domain-containing protein
MNQNDVYKFTFLVTCITDSCAGQSLASVSSTVIAGTGVPVPEPPSIDIFGTGLLALLGLGLAGHRRVCHRYA